MIPTDSATVVESFRNGTLDLGYLSSTDAARNLDQKTANILLVHLKNGKPHYNSIWLSLKNKPYESITELKDKPVAFASRSSTSGFLIPTWDLAKQGFVGPEKSLTDFFSQTVYGTGYVSAVEKVLSGEVEAAAVSDYVFKGDNKYLSDQQKEKLKIVQEQGPVPAHTLCIRSSISQNDRNFLQKAFLEITKITQIYATGFSTVNLLSSKRKNIFVSPEKHLMCKNSQTLRELRHTGFPAYFYDQPSSYRSRARPSD